MLGSVKLETDAGTEPTITLTRGSCWFFNGEVEKESIQFQVFLKPSIDTSIPDFPGNFFDLLQFYAINSAYLQLVPCTTIRRLFPSTPLLLFYHFPRLRRSNRGIQSTDRHEPKGDYQSHKWILKWQFCRNTLAKLLVKAHYFEGFAIVHWTVPHIMTNSLIL